MRGMPRGRASYEALSKPGFFGAPRQIWRVLRRHGARPAPILYVAVATVGTVLGVVLKLSIGLRWWVPPVVAVAGAWALSIIPIGLRGSGTRLSTELLTAVDPEKGWERRRREEHQRIRASQIPLFELEDWPGSGRLAGWGTSGGHATHVTLGFADDDDAAPTVWVSTFDGVHVTEQDVRSAVTSELAALAPSTQMSPAPPESVRDAHLSAAARVRLSPWTPASIRIDGEDVEASTVVTDLGTAMYGRLGQIWVATVVIGSGRVSLRLVSNDSVYLELPPTRAQTHA